MNRLRNRLIAVFLAATLAPLGVTLWITVSLLEHSLSFASTGRLDRLSRELETTGRELYRQARQGLREDASAGRPPAARYRGPVSSWPPGAREFWESGESERFSLAGGGKRLEYLVRGNREARLYSRDFGDVNMDRLSSLYREARAQVDSARARDLRRGFLSTLVLLAAGVWLVSLAVLVFLAVRISRPIHRLTAGLSRLAEGDLTARVGSASDDEVGQAITAFNRMAAQLQQSRERLVYLTQLASWQTLARKMAHEVKNSLTPIRLTVEEMLARQTGPDRAFLEQAAEIVTSEVESLERRVRAFSEFAAEPEVKPRSLQTNTLVAERISFLGSSHPEVTYRTRLSPDLPPAFADEDLVRGILTNLLENAAEAAGPGGTVLTTTCLAEGRVAIEVHDSGPGLSEQARRTVFEPIISFKKRGMGLGLSIARKSALLSGGDILLVKGELGGAGFRVLLPPAADAVPASPDRR